MDASSDILYWWVSFLIITFSSACLWGVCYVLLSERRTKHRLLGNEETVNRDIFLLALGLFCWQVHSINLFGLRWAEDIVGINQLSELLSSICLSFFYSAALDHNKWMPRILSKKLKQCEDEETKGALRHFIHFSQSSHANTLRGHHMGGAIREVIGTLALAMGLFAFVTGIYLEALTFVTHLALYLLLSFLLVWVFALNKPRLQSLKEHMTSYQQSHSGGNLPLRRVILLPVSAIRTGAMTWTLVVVAQGLGLLAGKKEASHVPFQQYLYGMLKTAAFCLATLFIFRYCTIGSDDLKLVDQGDQGDANNGEDEDGEENDILFRRRSLFLSAVDLNLDGGGDGGLNEPLFLFFFSFLPPGILYVACVIRIVNFPPSLLITTAIILFFGGLYAVLCGLLADKSRNNAINATAEYILKHRVVQRGSFRPSVKQLQTGVPGAAPQWVECRLRDRRKREYVRLAFLSFPDLFYFGFFRLVNVSLPGFGLGSLISQLQGLFMTDVASEDFAVVIRQVYWWTTWIAFLLHLWQLRAWKVEMGKKEQFVLATFSQLFYIMAATSIFNAFLLGFQCIDPSTHHALSFLTAQSGGGYSSIMPSVKCDNGRAHSGLNMFMTLNVLVYVAVASAYSNFFKDRMYSPFYRSIPFYEGIRLSIGFFVALANVFLYSKDDSRLLLAFFVVSFCICTAQAYILQRVHKLLGPASTIPNAVEATRYALLAGVNLCLVWHTLGVMYGFGTWRWGALYLMQVLVIVTARAFYKRTKLKAQGFDTFDIARRITVGKPREIVSGKDLNPFVAAVALMVGGPILNELWLSLRILVDGDRTDRRAARPRAGADDIGDDFPDPTLRAYLHLLVLASKRAQGRRFIKENLVDRVVKIHRKLTSNGYQEVQFTSLQHVGRILFELFRHNSFTAHKFVNKNFLFHVVVDAINCIQLSLEMETQRSVNGEPPRINVSEATDVLRFYYMFLRKLGVGYPNRHRILEVPLALPDSTGPNWESSVRVKLDSIYADVEELNVDTSISQVYDGSKNKSGLFFLGVADLYFWVVLAFPHREFSQCDSTTDSTTRYSCIVTNFEENLEKEGRDTFLVPPSSAPPIPSFFWHLQEMPMCHNILRAQDIPLMKTWSKHLGELLTEALKNTHFSSRRVIMSFVESVIPPVTTSPNLINSLSRSRSRGMRRFSTSASTRRLSSSSTTEESLRSSTSAASSAKTQGLLPGTGMTLNDILVEENVLSSHLSLTMVPLEKIAPSIMTRSENGVLYWFIHVLREELTKVEGHGAKWNEPEEGEKGPMSPVVTPFGLHSPRGVGRRGRGSKHNYLQGFMNKKVSKNAGRFLLSPRKAGSVTPLPSRISNPGLKSTLVMYHHMLHKTSCSDPRLVHKMFRTGLSSQGCISTFLPLLHYTCGFTETNCIVKVLLGHGCALDAYIPLKADIKTLSALEAETLQADTYEVLKWLSRIFFPKDDVKANALARLVWTKRFLDGKTVLRVTPLHIAAATGNDDLVSLLLARGASLKRSISIGVSYTSRSVVKVPDPLRLAKLNHHERVIQILVQHCIDHKIEKPKNKEQRLPEDTTDMTTGDSLEQHCIEHKIEKKKNEERLPGKRTRTM